MHRPQQVSAHSEEILDHAVDRREALQMDGRLEGPHPAFPLSRRLMRHLSAVVRILTVQWTTDGITLRHAAG